eukprot:101074_1
MAFSNEEAKIFLAFTTIILFIKVIITLGKKGANETRPPEDKTMAIQDEELQRLTSSEDDEDDDNNGNTRLQMQSTLKVKRRFTKKQRWKRIAMNDLENIPLGLIILWVNIICNSNPYVTATCSVIFTVSRLFHTILYAYSIQPFRSIAFTIGSFAIFAAGIN